ncbi:MAG: hypothetical protein AAB428_00180 [Patescibacteria group bacterium]
MKLSHVALLVLAVIVFSGCKERVREKSDVLHEDAVITETVYTPSRHDLDLGITALKTGPIGMDFSGDLGLRIGGGLQISSTTVPEKFAVVFKCKHGKFIVTRKAVYEKFKGQDGKAVDVAYRENYRATYDTVNGERKLIERVLTDFEFIDATVK